MTKKTILLFSALFFLNNSPALAVPDLEDVEQFVGPAQNFFMGTVFSLLPIFGHERVRQAFTAKEFYLDHVRGSRAAFITGSLLGNYLWFYLFDEFKKRHGKAYAYTMAAASFIPFVVEHAINKLPKPAVRS